MASRGRGIPSARDRANVSRTMYRAAAELVRKYPILKANPGYYVLQRARSFRKARVRAETASRPEVVRELEQHGFATMTGLFSPSDIDAWREAVLEIKGRVVAGERAPGVFLNPDGPPGLFRVERASEVIPATSAFFRHPELDAIARAYLSPEVVSFRNEIDVRFASNQNLQADLYHFDNWRPILKAFLLLTDVGEDQAPFRYLCGSHRWGLWRYRHEVDFDVHGPDGRFGHFFPQEVRKLRREHSWREVLGTGRAGTLILADTRGLHAGTVLRNGHRLLLSNTWDLMNAP